MILSLGALFLLAACNHQNNYVNTSSPLYPILYQTRMTQDRAAESKARDFILTELPCGSSEAAISQFLSKHLTEVHRKSPAYQFSKPFICVQTSEWGSMAGGGGTEIVFLLDHSRRLKDVHVYSEATTL